MFGCVVALISVATGLISNTTGGTVGSALFGAGAIVMLPIFSGGIGFLMTLIGAWLYNIAAGVVGGIEMDVQ